MATVAPSTGDKNTLDVVMGAWANILGQEIRDSVALEGNDKILKTGS